MSKSINVSSTKQALVAAAVGLDLSDKRSTFVALDTDGLILTEGKVVSREIELTSWAKSFAPTLIAIEAGPLSTWVSRVLSRCGHEVVVANPAKVPSISRSRSKSDSRDARQLARLVRFDRSMLHEIQHRSEEVQRHLQYVRSRGIAVETRTKLLGHVRGALKSYGIFIARCSSEVFTRRVRATVPDALLQALSAILEVIDSLSAAIKSFDNRVEQLVRGHYPDAQRLTEVAGVGALTALTYVLVIADAARFKRSRMVGPYLGLTPARDQSGDSDPQKGISKEGDRLLRKLLVQSAHYIIGRFGPDSDLRRHGLKIAARGGKNAKKRAAVAVARKLAVVLHHLWKTREIYIPLLNAPAASAA